MTSVSMLPLKASECEKSADFIGSGIRQGQYHLLCCLVDMVDQFPDPPRERICVKVSFEVILVGD